METRVFESKFNVLSVPKLLTKAQMIRYKGGNGYGYGGYDSGDAGTKTCWRRCYTYSGEPTATTYKESCYDHYGECTFNGWIADCTCCGTCTDY